MHLLPLIQLLKRELQQFFWHPLRRNPERSRRQQPMFSPAHTTECGRALPRSHRSEAVWRARPATYIGESRSAAVKCAAHGATRQSVPLSISSST
jgi:hypothetical protein